MQCLNCGKDIRDSAKVCGYCGYQVRKSPQNCPNCGKEAREGAKVCGYCGYKFTVASKPEPKPVPAIQAESKPKVESPLEARQKAAPTPKAAKIPEVKRETGSPSISQEVIKTESMDKHILKRRFPIWAWVIIGLIIITGSIVGGIQFISSSQLPDIVTSGFPNASIVWEENFNSSPKNFRLRNAQIKNGVVELKGNGVQFDNLMNLTPPLSEGDGVLTLYKIEPASSGKQWWLIDLYTRNGTEYYASIGFSEWYHPYIDVLGQTSDTNFTGLRTPPPPGVWYYSFFAITNEDEIKLMVWEQDNPERISRHTWSLPPHLSGRAWIAGYSGHAGILYIDSVTLVSIP